MSAQLAQALKSTLRIDYENDTGPGDEGFWEWWSVIDEATGETLCKCDDEATAKRILAALAAHEAATQQEPVAWRVRRHDAPKYWIAFLHYPVDAMADPEREVQPLYAAPQQEPAITVTIDDLDLVQDWAESRLPPGTHKLYAAPQQAQAPTLSGLTDETKSALWRVGADLAQAQAPIDPDGAESRAGFRAFDESQMARWATPWHVWREAVKWAAPQQGRKS